MNTILVPSDGDNELSVHAVYFALEFAKRTGAKVLFLRVDRDCAQQSTGRRHPEPTDRVPAELERVISSGRVRGIEVETHFTNGDYVGRVAAFARDHNVSRVVAALPDPNSPAFSGVEGQVNDLRVQLDCVVVTVRPRRDRQRELDQTAVLPPDGER